MASFIGVARMQLEDQLYTTKAVVVLLAFLTGDFPVRSIYIVPFFLSIEIKLQIFDSYFPSLVEDLFIFQFQCARVLWWLFPWWIRCLSSVASCDLCR